jgi:ectoine hydroxylase-related dioxygenase (phytanoyl-CoA dioxygenase family)
MTGFGLTPGEVARFEEDGLVAPDRRLPDDLMDRLRGLTERVLREYPDRQPEFLFASHVPWEGQADTSLADGFMEVCRHPAILDAVESLIGHDIVLWASRLFCKPARTGLEIPWHQDGNAWPIRPLASVAVWIAVDPATPENGCMRYVAGSHRLGRVDHTASPRTDLAVSIEVDARHVDESRVRHNRLEPGQFSLHHMFLVHASAPNRSGRRRAGFAIRYMPSTSHYDRSMKLESQSNQYEFDLASRPIFLVRGVDRCGLNDFTVGHPSPQVLERRSPPPA